MDNAVFQELLESVKEAGKIRRGEVEPSREFVYIDVDVKAIREKTSLSQAKFASMIGVSKRTLESWEQDKRHPTGPAKALLAIVNFDPEFVMKALHNR